MPQITVWCLPPDLGEDCLRELFNAIVAATCSVKELGLHGENDVLVLFPVDMMKYGIGTEIMVQVSELWDKPERTSDVRNALAKALGTAVKKMFPKAVVAARLDPPFLPERDGFWASNMPEYVKKKPIDMTVAEFFTIERFDESDRQTKGRLKYVIKQINEAAHEKHCWGSMRLFLKEYKTKRDLESIYGVGRKFTNYIAWMVNEAGLATLA